jgi:hypothetical protein
MKHAEEFLPGDIEGIREAEKEFIEGKTQRLDEVLRDP